jgi:hypothetical protein
MRPLVFLAQLHQDPLVSSVPSDQSLEGQDKVRKIREEIVAQGSELSEIVSESFPEAALLTENVAVELRILQVVLGRFEVGHLVFQIPLADKFGDSTLEALEVAYDALEVIDSELGNLAVLVCVFEERLERVVREE